MSAVLHYLTLIEKCAREAREMKCHSDQLRETAARKGIEVVSDPMVISAVRGNGKASVGPSEKAQLVAEADQAGAVSGAMIRNMFGAAALLQREMGKADG